MIQLRAVGNNGSKGRELQKDSRANEIDAAIHEIRFSSEDALGLLEMAHGRRERLETLETIVDLVCLGQRREEICGDQDL